MNVGSELGSGNINVPNGAAARTVDILSMHESPRRILQVFRLYPLMLLMFFVDAKILERTDQLHTRIETERKEKTAESDQRGRGGARAFEQIRRATIPEDDVSMKPLKGCPGHRFKSTLARTVHVPSTRRLSRGSFCFWLRSCALDSIAHVCATLFFCPH